MPYPEKGEEKNHYISRCVSEVMKEGKPQKQALAICFSYWEKKQIKEDVLDRIELMLGDKDEKEG